MKRFCGSLFGVLLVTLLYIVTCQSISAMEQYYDRAGQHTAVVAQDIFVSPNPCAATFHDQEILDDGNWLQICLIDPNAPDQSTVTEVHVKYLLDHSDPNQLELRLASADASISQTLWNRGKVIKGAKLGEAGFL